jgi:signal transduction histidine kinase
MTGLQRQLNYDTLFEVTTDAIALVAVTASGCRIRDVNEVFETAFECDGPDVKDEDLTTVVGFESDTDIASRLRTAAADGSVVTFMGRGDGLVLRARRVDTDDGVQALVVADLPDDDDLSAPNGIDGGICSAIDATATMAHASDAAQACEGAAQLLLEAFGFDAVVVDLDDGPSRQENVDEPIQVPRSAKRVDTFTGHDIEDRRNDERWGIVVQYPLDEHGVVQAAAQTDAPVDPHLARGLELFGRYFETALDRLEPEYEEAVMFNRILRHEMMNGLNLLQARLSLFESDVASENQEHYETVEARISDMIDRVETIREMCTEGSSRTRTTRRLAPIVHGQVDSASDQYPDASFAVVDQIPDVEVAVDDRLEFCLRNVLRNAVQHADVETPAVRIDVNQVDGRVQIRIADNGPGIPDSVEGAIFGRGVTSLEGSHGEGLFLTARIIEDLYDGQVRASTSDQGGAELCFELPLAAE